MTSASSKRAAPKAAPATVKAAVGATRPTPKTASKRSPSAVATTKTPVASRSARSAGPPKKAARTARPARATKPHGRDEIVQSVIDATLELWRAKGTVDLSLRSIAAQADVNYGLVYRHFGTKETLIRAAMDRVVARSLGFIEESPNLMGAIENILPRSTGAHARLLAWTILQYVVDELLPEHDPFLERLRTLANPDSDSSDEDALANAAMAGSLIAMLYGWRLFEPYLVRGLGLQALSHDQVDALIRDNIVQLMKAQR